MSNNTKKSVLHQIRKFKNSILQFSHLPFADTLSSDVLEQIIEHSESCRDRIFIPLVTIKAFIFQVLSTDGSCRQAVNHVLSERLFNGCPANSIKTGAYCKTKKRLPHDQLKQAVESSGKTYGRKIQLDFVTSGYSRIFS